MNYHGLLVLTAVLLAAIWLGGCQAYVYESPDGSRLTIHRLGTDAEIGTLRAGRGEHGAYIELEGVKSETEQMIGTAIRAALEGGR